MKYKVIEIRNMHSAIHELFIVNSKLKTVDKAFKTIENSAEIEDLAEAEYKTNRAWDTISLNTEHFGEVNFREKKSNSKYGDHYEFDGDIYEIVNYPFYDLYM